MVLAESFHQTFLAELYAGLISGVVTGGVIGLLVGLAIFRIERQSDRKQESDAAMREIAVLKGKLRFSTAGNDIIDCLSAKSSVPYAAVSTLKEIENLPIAQWLELVGDREPVLAHLANLQENVAEYKRIASQIDDRIRGRILADPAMRKHPELPSYIFTQFYEQVRGQRLDPEDAKNLVRPRLAVGSELDSFFENEFKDDAVLTLMIETLYRRRRQIIEIMREIRDAIGPPAGATAKTGTR